MASAPAPTLPLFYQDLMPLNSRDHAHWKSRTTDQAVWLKDAHAVPLTTDEFIQASRNFPIIFSVGENPVPLALMGLNEGVNTFFDAEGRMIEPVYVPAYARRYPFMLAKLTPESEDLSLCFDPTSDLIGEFDEGTALFDGETPSEGCQATLEFCKNFEEAGFRTQAFVDELAKNGLLMEGEVAIQQAGREEPYVYRGFQMVNQEKLRELRGDVLRTMNQNGMLPLIFAHLFSLERMSEIFGRQVQQGTGPVPEIALPPL